ncbi:MAG TPA: glycine dehydrogenase (aminomethyl-transferring) [Bacteroidales bacterium]|nr:glycine dehydrogenase (aminomethyl-transferring) [Bacteroidales bacterium]
MTDFLPERHIGIEESEERVMLDSLGLDTLQQLIDNVVPDNIKLKDGLNLPEQLSESEYLHHIEDIARSNDPAVNFIGQGWYGTKMPSVIIRNIYQNPSWYTSYTPYQAEISQGRLEALFNFQTAVSDFTALPLANCSMLDEATAVAEAATMMRNIRTRKKVQEGANKLLVDEKLFAATIAVLKTRCSGQGIDLVVGNPIAQQLDASYFGIIVQYPDKYGNIEDYSALCDIAHSLDIKVTAAADIMALALLPAPGSWGADICVGSTQRWGIPMAFGGPSAAYMACREEYKRELPGRIIGLSKDTEDKPAFRLALQTREQHIKREKATSNICTAEALMAVMASMYTIYHGAKGIREIAENIHSKAVYISELLPVYGYSQLNAYFFDTLLVQMPDTVSIKKLQKEAQKLSVNINYVNNKLFTISTDETTSIQDINALIEVLAVTVDNNPVYVQSEEEILGLSVFDDKQLRDIDYLKAPVFNQYHTETELMRYIKRLERKDISLTHSMIPLGSCTMKLNPASTMLPITSSSFADVHPMAPTSQTEGYQMLIERLKHTLCLITGFSATNLQPTSGAAGEFTGLVVIREYHRHNNQGHRNIILIPQSAHGTNPASAVQAGFTPITVACDEQGNIDINDWELKACQYTDQLAGCMITYPSTHGIFEEDVKAMCDIIHRYGGQVYMDGANMNAQVGLTNPAVIGADVCHLNFHKTFASPHGGGGPGAGAVCVADHLIPYMPSEDSNRVSSSLEGNAGIAEICYAYIRMMGEEGLTRATKIAILNANYLAAKLKEAYGVVYTNKKGYVGHELILDCRQFKAFGITENDIAKRLMDYGYHAPTLSFPVHGTLMIEPTESESLHELNQFIDAMLHIRAEIQDVIDGKLPQNDNPLVNAPHAEYQIVSDNWTHPYGRLQAAYPTPWVATNKFWVPVARVDNGYGDRNLVARY